jgi:AcrR family transcriptional regulator
MQCYIDGMMATSADTSSSGSDALEPGAPPDHVRGGGRRERKKHATRQALRNAALELVAERGFAHVTVDDIAEAADVATRTFFNYFPTKESAVIGADPERIERVRTGLLARPIEETALEALRSVMVECAGAIEEELGDPGEGRDAWSRRFTVIREDPDLLGAYSAHVADVEGVLVAALAERLGRDPAHDPYLALVTAAVCAATRVAALHWSANGATGSLARFTGAAINGLARGLPDDEALLVALEPTGHAARRRLPPGSDEAGRRGE